MGQPVIDPKKYGPKIAATGGKVKITVIGDGVVEAKGANAIVERK